MACTIQDRFKVSNKIVAEEFLNKKELFRINYNKYIGEGFDSSQKEVLESLFAASNTLNCDDSKGTERNINQLNQIAQNLNTKSEPADILRELAFAYEKIGDTHTAEKIMSQAHFLRPSGPLIKQKLVKYKRQNQ